MSYKTLPKVAIIGRPNVGKSSLFNKLTRTRKSVVRNEPGVTRDILIEPAHWWGREFAVVDSGGLTEQKDTFSQLIYSQVLEMLKSVDMIVLVMDARAGIMPEDRDVFRIAKETGRPFVVVVNKIDDTVNPQPLLNEFYEFGVELIPAAFEKDFGIDHIVEWVFAHAPEKTTSDRQGIRMAIVGKPNVGKSSLCNRFLGQKRMLVSDIAGTTVDAVEEAFEYNGTCYVLVDTAGLRRSSKRHEGVERLSAVKSYEAIKRAEIVLLVIDGCEGLSNQDAKLLDFAMEQHKAVILVANKYDLAKQKIPEYKAWLRDQVASQFRFFPDILLSFVSAASGFGVESLLDLVKETHEKLQTRISTSQLNKFFFETIRQAPAPVYGTTDVKFYYLTQTHQTPPSFIAFANYPQGVTDSYRRFLTKRLREHFDLKGIPIRIFAMPSRKSLDEEMTHP